MKYGRIQPSSNGSRRVYAPIGCPTPSFDVLVQTVRPWRRAKVEISQTRHEFLFGANLFMLNAFLTSEENRQFEKASCSIFNYATVPFYWDKLEPVQDKPRFTKDSPPI